MRTAITCFVLGLSFAPQLAVAANQDSALGARIGDSLINNNQLRFSLAPSEIFEEIGVSGERVHKFSPESRSSREAEGARFGDGEIQYFEGPAWDRRLKSPRWEAGWRMRHISRTWQ
jgi:hypothetical protein